MGAGLFFLFLNHSWKHTEKSLATQNRNKWVTQWRGNNTLTFTTEYSTSCWNYPSTRRTKVSQLQQFTAIMIKAVFVKFEKCHIGEEEKTLEKKVKLYAEVELSAQGYDTRTRTQTHKTGLCYQREGVRSPHQDSPLSATRLLSACRENHTGRYVHTHTINRIYNLSISHNSYSSIVTSPKDAFCTFYLPIIQSATCTHKKSTSLRSDTTSELPSFFPPWLWYSSAALHACRPDWFSGSLEKQSNINHTPGGYRWNAQEQTDVTFEIRTRFPPDLFISLKRNKSKSLDFF